MDKQNPRNNLRLKKRKKGTENPTKEYSEQELENIHEVFDTKHSERQHGVKKGEKR